MDNICTSSSANIVGLFSIHFGNAFGFNTQASPLFPSLTDVTHHPGKRATGFTVVVLPVLLPSNSLIKTEQAFTCATGSRSKGLSFILRVLPSNISLEFFSGILPSDLVSIT